MTNEEQTKPEPEPCPPAYDFEYICRCLGMIPVGPQHGAVNLNTILWIEPIAGLFGAKRFHLPEGIQINVMPDEMAELERRLKEREATVARLRAEAIERDAKQQIDAQMRAANDVITAAKVQGEIMGNQRRRPQ